MPKLLTFSPKARHICAIPETQRPPPPVECIYKDVELFHTQHPPHPMSSADKMTLCFPDRPRIACFRPMGRPTTKNEAAKGLSAHLQQNSEIFTKKVEVTPAPEARKTQEKSPKRQSETWFQPPNALFLHKKQCFPSAKPTLFRQKTCNLTPENMQSLAAKHALSRLKGYFRPFFILPFVCFRKVTRQTKRRFSDILQGKQQISDTM